MLVYHVCRTSKLFIEVICNTIHKKKVTNSLKQFDVVSFKHLIAVKCMLTHRLYRQFIWENNFKIFKTRNIFSLKEFEREIVLPNYLDLKKKKLNLPFIFTW